MEMAVKRLSAKPLFVCEGYLSGQPVHKQDTKGNVLYNIPNPMTMSTVRAGGEWITDNGEA